MEKNIKLFINWSDPVRCDSQWVRKWIIPKDYLEGFFIFWKNHNKRLKSKGYNICKNEFGQWTLSERQTHKHNFRENFGKDKTEGFQKIQTESILPEYQVKNVSGLKKFQVPIVAKLCAAISTWGAALDGSETGSGKTYSAIATTRELGIGIAVICPKAVIHAWHEVVEKHFGMQAEFILNYESVKTGKYPNIGTWKKTSKTSTREYFKWNIPKNTLLVFDESHRLKGRNTQNSEIAIQAKKQGYKILCCSATSTINPIEMKALGFILDIYKKGKWTQYLREHGCEQGRFGWQFNGSQQVLKKLHTDLFLNKGVRIRREDIADFPDCDIIAESYNVDEKSEKDLKNVYEEMDRELAVLKAKCKTTQEYKINGMVVMLRSWQRAELIKVPLFVEMVEDAIEDGMSVVIFVNFSDTVRAISTRLNTNCIVWGENKEGERDKNVADFQSDKERIIVVNIKAGGSGLSLHDTNGNYPRLALISPTPSAVDLVQSMGRVWRVGGKTKALQKIIFAANTVEEKICDKVKTKINNLSLINDGDLSLAPAFMEDRK